MRTLQLLVATLVCVFLVGCASTEKRNAEIALAEQKFAEFAPRIEQLRAGMSRAEVEKIIQPDQKVGFINTSGFMYCRYRLSPEVVLWLHFHGGAQEGGELPTDSLRAVNGQAQVLVKTPAGREKWVELSFTPKSRVR